jgi:putative FmdB family regulatory protein
MPVYEYKCRRCGETFEMMQKFSDPALELHGDCGGEVERLVSAPAIKFKGSGWYVNDYAKGSGSKGSSGSQASSPKSEAPKESAAPPKTDSKK